MKKLRDGLVCPGPLRNRHIWDCAVSAHTSNPGLWHWDGPSCSSNKSEQRLNPGSLTSIQALLWEDTLQENPVRTSRFPKVVKLKTLNCTSEEGLPGILCRPILLVFISTWSRWQNAPFPSKSATRSSWTKQGKSPKPCRVVRLRTTHCVRACEAAHLPREHKGVCLGRKQSTQRLHALFKEYSGQKPPTTLPQALTWNYREKSPVITTTVNRQNNENRWVHLFLHSVSPTTGCLSFKQNMNNQPHNTHLVSKIPKM